MAAVLNTEILSKRTDIIAKDRANVWHHLMQHKNFESSDPLIIVEADGMRLKDAHGKNYLDATSGGLWTVNVGYGRECIAKAVAKQLTKMPFFAGYGGSQPAAEFSEMLLTKMPGMGRVYFSSSGSEANEKAFKIVRQLAHKKYQGKKNKIIYRDRDYHGTTIATLSATGQFERKNQYGPFVPGFVEMPHCSKYRCQYENTDNYGVRSAEELEKIILKEGADTVGAVILEPITAGGGVITPPEGYWETIQAICKRYDVLLIIDEVVCGLGRTGKWFGYQHYGIQPDIVTMAKGVASGYAAISCTVTTEAIFDEFKQDASDRMDYFRDVSTFGGCTGGPTAAIETLQILEEENLLENATKVGDYLMQRLLELKSRHEIIGDVRGKGLIAGIELVENRKTKVPVDESVIIKIAAHCMENGVLIGRTNRSFRELNNTIALCPALIANEQDIDEVVTALDFAIKDL